ncbi:exopolysaccharide biosynthesis polyprenyl glycosylphosphotransferase [Methylobacterium sp. Leaf104]|uniref:exopolysaccharide biosynthesis polyprenyl glycosylphosphotransferase n=1 Tax=Methylobacterium TaxID=407 RepID=UPI0006FF5602|nr:MULTISPECIES: exopolysaccharide biosynthesis polyprenyl glycosylphosphotransferase [Methylobacterium]KQP42963.1 exopolysaccharide biosynthesis polyprenyl glycosylphosphotransferase [Methylobacterium sp. Leaf104]MCI9879095.1 exopolysaccharide biosynthesis polyprenyl glycosylphosphotransferase [Methylobacterium goesingense]
MFHDRIPASLEKLPIFRTRRDVWAALLPRRSRTAFRIGLSAATALAEILVIFLVAAGIDLAYHAAFDGTVPMAARSGSFELAALIALFVLLTNLVREDYNIETLLSRRPHLRRAATVWTGAWAIVLLIGFATKTTHEYSRLVSLGFFLTGLPAVLLARGAMLRVVRSAAATTSGNTNRVHLVGYEEDIARFYAHNDPEALGLRVIGTSYLRALDPVADAASRTAQMSEDLDLAVSVVRFLRPDDVFILVPWSEASDIERCIDAFLRVPAALHLRPGSVMDRFPDLTLARVGRLSGINIGRRPLQAGELFLKRSLDLALALVALVLLSPLFLVVAVLVKIDSPGPVFFRQKRYGFNQQPFGVFKFRSMKAEPETVFKQATRNDSRITPIGRVLRRSNIDELPQLLNVVLGEMSLVGPRPHALAHDRSFENRIALYARRHNVMPGITGWAQVNGLRGETLTDLDMERRVQHDLHYIDNWSIWLDLRIMFMTVFSRRAYRNAC